MNIQHGQLWAITSFFNPAGYERRLINYRRFRAALQVPLAAIELSFNGRWELQEHDADILIRVKDGDVMWQKERLLNQLIKRLPPECKYIAWVDSDVLFQDPQWPHHTIETLETVPLTQLFTTLRYLTPDESNPANTLCVSSVASAVQAGRSPSDMIGHLTDGYPNIGMAWAARRSLLEQHGLYDGCVIGGGDSALVCAAFGVPEIVMRLHGMNPAQRERYLCWAQALHNNVKGQVGALTGEIHHLWHGDLESRRYGPRHRNLVQHDFDPNTDLRPGVDGAWRWASNKPELHATVHQYFHSRNEDGDTGIGATEYN